MQQSGHAGVCGSGGPGVNSEVWIHRQHCRGEKHKPAIPACLTPVQMTLFQSCLPRPLVVITDFH